jgi:hypothetical protein
MSLGHFRQKTRLKHIITTSPLGSLLSIFAVYVLTYVGSKTFWLCVTDCAAETSKNVVYLLHICLGIADCTHSNSDIFFVVILIQLPQFRCYKVQNKESLLDWPVSRWCKDSRSNRLAWMITIPGLPETLAYIIHYYLKAIDADQFMQKKRRWGL